MLIQLDLSAISSFLSVDTGMNLFFSSCSMASSTSLSPSTSPLALRLLSTVTVSSPSIRVSVLFTSEMIRKNGLPYKEYFIWGDDSEYTIRLASKYPCYIALKSKVIHKRVVQKSILFENEKDKKRLAFYVYKYRNEAFSQISRGDKTKCSLIIDLFFQGVKYLLKGKVSHSVILLKSVKQLLYFSPQIKYIKQ